MNYTYRSQSLYPETMIQHRPVCPVNLIDASALPAQLSTSELLDMIHEFAPLIDAWHEYVQELKNYPRNLDMTLLLCTNDGFVIDHFELGAGKRFVSTKVTQVGTNFFHSIDVHRPFAEESKHLQSDCNICAHRIMQDLCNEQDIYAVCSPIEIDKPSFKNILVVITHDNSLLMHLFVQSISLGIAHASINRIHQHATRLIRNVLLRRLDCHTIFLDENNNLVEEFHAIRLGNSELDTMRQITKQGESSTMKRTIGNRIYRVDVIKIEDETGQCPSTLGLFRDISNFEQYSDRLQDMEKYSSLVTLSAGIAHEIRNPLTTARGFLQLFLKKSESPSDREFLSLTITELDRIQTLLNDFMNIAKPETPSKQPVNLVGIVNEITQFLCPEASLKNVLFKVGLPPEPVYIYADVSEIKQVFINILQNAVQACTSTGEVTISTVISGRYVSVEFKDSGCGIEDTSKLFHPFFTTKATGTGLGLFVSKHIIDDHGGNIEVESTIGYGTTVRVSLPILDYDKQTVPNTVEP